MREFRGDSLTGARSWQSTLCLSTEQVLVRRPLSCHTVLFFNEVTPVSFVAENSDLGFWVDTVTFWRLRSFVLFILSASDSAGGMLTMFEDCSRDLQFAPQVSARHATVRTQHLQAGRNAHVHSRSQGNCVHFVCDTVSGTPTSDFALSVSVKNTPVSKWCLLSRTCRSVGCSGFLLNRVSHAHEFTGRFLQLRARYEFLHFRRRGGVTRLRVAVRFGLQRHSKKCERLQSVAIQKPPRSSACGHAALQPSQLCLIL